MMMDSQTIFLQAIECERKADYTGAVRAYRSLAAENPPYRPAVVNLGSLYSRMELFDDAIECFSRALTISEDHLSWFNLGSVLYRKNDFKQAVIAFERARRVNPSFTLATLVMGLSLRKMKHIPAAEKCFIEVLAADPVNEVALVALSVIAYDESRYDRALALIERLIEKRPDSVSAKKMRGKILLSLGRSDGADDLKQAAKEDEGFTRFDRMMTDIPQSAFTDARGTLDEKIERLEEKIEAEPKKEDFLTLSLCCLFNGESDRAIDYLFMAKN